MKFITVPNISKKDIDELKKEMKKAEADPSYVIITNYEVWFQDLDIGSNPTVKSEGKKKSKK